MLICLMIYGVLLRADVSMCVCVCVCVSVCVCVCFCACDSFSISPKHVVQQG